MIEKKPEEHWIDYLSRVAHETGLEEIVQDFRPDAARVFDLRVFESGSLVDTGRIFPCWMLCWTATRGGLAGEEDSSEVGLYIQVDVNDGSGSKIPPRDLGLTGYREYTELAIENVFSSLEKIISLAGVDLDLSTVKHDLICGKTNTVNMRYDVRDLQASYEGARIRPDNCYKNTSEADPGVGL